MLVIGLLIETVRRCRRTTDRRGRPGWLTCRRLADRASDLHGGASLAFPDVPDGSPAGPRCHCPV